MISPARDHRSWSFVTAICIVQKQAPSVRDISKALRVNGGYTFDLSISIIDIEQSIIDDDHKLDRILETTNLDENTSILTCQWSNMMTHHKANGYWNGSYFGY